MIVAPRPPRIFLECTYTHYRGGNTGIQRVVRNILAHAPEVGRELGVECQPVIYRRRRLFPVPALRRLPQDRGRWRHYAERVWDGTTALFSSGGAIEPVAGDVLFLLDTSWRESGLKHVVRDARARGVRSGFLLYDLIPVEHPEVCVPSVVRSFRRWLDWVVQECDFGMAISSASRDALLANLGNGRALGDIGVNPLGMELDLADGEGSSISPAVQACLESCRERPLFLAVGTIEPRKNHDFLLDGFNRAWEQGLDASLVIVGRPGWLCESTLRRFREHPRRGADFHYLGGVNDAELSAIYEAASTLVAASVAEGYGLPVAEGLSRGLSVLASDLPVHRETAQGQARFFDLGSVESLAEALRGEIPAPDGTLHWPTWRESTVSLLKALTAHSGEGAAISR